MKAKTIKTVLRRKTNAWLESIEDKEVRSMASMNAIVTGGSIASMLLGDKPNDFDIYFQDRDTLYAVADYYRKVFNKKMNSEMVQIKKDNDGRVRLWIRSAGIAGAEETEQGYQYFEGDLDPDSTAAADYLDQLGLAKDKQPGEKPKYSPIVLTENAITLSNDIQIVLRFHGSPDQIHKNFDFVHCMNYWESGTNHLELRKDALESILAKELRYNGSKYPICSVMRLRKFLSRGWTINAGQILKMSFQISELDLNDLGVLREQLTGVGVAYFMELLSLVKKHQEESDKKTIDQTYLMELIDRVF